MLIVDVVVVVMFFEGGRMVCGAVKVMMWLREELRMMW